MSVYGIKTKSLLSDKIHDQIMEIVIQESGNCDLTFTENSLVDKFGVSKAPVREALIKLCGEGVLRSIPRYGYTVIRITEQDARNLIQFRLILEKEALKLSYKNIGEQHMNEIKNYLEKYQFGKDTDIWQEWEDNIKFHTMLISFLDNDIMTENLRKTMETQLRFFAQMRYRRNKSFYTVMNQSSHERIYDALEKKDIEKALYNLEKDIVGSDNIVVATLSA